MSVRDWLAFNRLAGIGNRTQHLLLDQFGNPTQVFAAGPGAWRAAGLSVPQITALQAGPQAIDLSPDLAWLEQPDTHLLTWADADYPRLLREIADPPVLLYLRGRRACLQQPMLAIVGSRNPTPVGNATAQAFAKHLGQAGLTIVSGLALGIDAAAHRGALAAHAPTIAVMGTGPDRIYPRQHRELAHQIAESGLLISDYPTGTAVRPALFPQRNRIISGLGYGVLVVEAALQSGSLITARLAGEQGREVFAIPGSIHSPLSRGPHRLIRDGAKLVETAQDILEELGPLHGVAHASGTPGETPARPADPQQALVFDALTSDPQPFDDILAHSGLTASQLSAILLALELDGWAASSPGGRYSRLPV